MSASADLSINVDFFAPEVVKNPWDLLEEIGNRGPIVFHEGMQMWLLTNFAEIKSAMAKPMVFNSQPEFTEAQFGRPTMQGYDGEYHDKLREIWNRDFQRNHVQDYRAFMTPMVAGLVAAVAERVEAGETVDVVDTVTHHIPIDVITRLMGVGGSRLREYARWIDEIALSTIALIDPDPVRREQIMTRAKLSTDEMMAALTEEVAARAGEETDDLIGRKHPDPDFEVTVEEHVTNIAGLVFAGYETTSKLMAHAVVQLAQHPEQRRLLVEDPTRIPAAIEEVLRYASIVQMLPRRTAEEVTVAGVTLPTGTPVMMMMALANRDPERWPDPNRFDITRKPEQHFGFGFGTHLCLGQNLARLEAVVFLEELLKRLPDWELAEEVDYGMNFFLRGPQSVYITAG